MGFMDKAKKLAEQAQQKLDEAQQQFNESQQQRGEQRGQGQPIAVRQRRASIPAGEEAGAAPRQQRLGNYCQRSADGRGHRHRPPSRRRGAKPPRTRRPIGER